MDDFKIAVKGQIRRATGKMNLYLEFFTTNPKSYKRFSLGMGINAEYWIGESNDGPWLREIDDLAKLRNQKIREAIREGYERHQKLKYKLDHDPTVIDVYQDMMGIKPKPPEPVKKTMLIPFITDYTIANILSENTAYVYTCNLVNAVTKFLKEKYNTNDFDLKQIDVTFIYRFEMYLKKANATRSKKDGAYKAYSPGTIGEYLFKLKAVLRYAKKIGEIAIDIADDHENMDRPEKAKEIIGNLKEAIFWKIQPDELLRIETHPISADDMKDELTQANNQFMYDLVRVRLLFLLQTWTGMAYADLVNMKNMKEYIIKDLTGKRTIIYYRHKTGELAVVPVFEQTDVVLEALEYNANPLSSYDTYYRKIKALLRYYTVDIDEDEKSVTHMGRHLFGSRMLHMGFPMESISRMMGHSSIKETEKVYARIDFTKVHADYDRIMLNKEIGTKIAV